MTDNNKKFATPLEAIQDMRKINLNEGKYADGWEMAIDEAEYRLMHSIEVSGNHDD